jgi:3-mercaptopyruvate sulfurtransferase SseA
VRASGGAPAARWLAAALLAAVAFSSAGAAPGGDPEIPEKYVSVDEARKLSDTPRKPIFVDVREPGQFAELHIRGARNVPLTELPKRLAEIPREPTVLLY